MPLILEYLKNDVFVYFQTLTDTSPSEALSRFEMEAIQ